MIKPGICWAFLLLSTEICIFSFKCFIKVVGRSVMQDLFKTDFLSVTRDNEWHLEPFEVEHSDYNISVWDTGVMHIEPKAPTDTKRCYIFSCAVHGNETAPIEICNDIIQEILHSKTAITQPVLFIFGNPASINIGKRFVEENMNRLFSGHHSSADDNGYRNKECERAAKLEQYVTRFFGLYPTWHRTHYDLHTAIRDSAHEKFAVYPYLHGKNWQKQQFEILRAMGVTTFLLMEKPATTFSYYSSKEHGAEAFTVELGKVRPFGENDQTKFAAAKQTLVELLKGKLFDGEEFDAKNYQIMTVNREIIKHNDSFELCFSDDVANFTQFSKGEVLAKEDGSPIEVEIEGEAIVFPNAKVANGQRALLTVVPKDISDSLS